MRIPTPVRHCGWGRRLLTLGLVGLLGALGPLVSTPPRATPQAGGDPATAGPRIVGVGVYVVDIPNINEADNTFDVELDVIARWETPPGSPIDRSGPRIYTGPQAEEQMATLWSPQIIAANAVGSLSMSRIKVSTHPEGWVEIQARVHGALRAPLDFRHFPFDTQQLVIHLEPFAWNAQVASLDLLPDRTGFDSSFQLSEWAVRDIHTSISTVTTSRDTIPYSRLTVDIEIRRKSRFYVWKGLVPLFTIVALSWVVFWMNEEGLGRRAGVSVTGILTLIAYQFLLTESLPRLAYLTILDKIILLSVLLVAATMIINIIAGQGGLLSQPGRRRLDRICRWIFPLVYVSGMALIALRNL